VPLENDLNIAKRGVKNFTTDEILISILTNSNQVDVLELVNQYPQEFDDAISFYSIGIHPGILPIVWKQIWELSKVNCKKRIVLPWANGLDKRNEIEL
jgi:hypothetical protein